MSGKKVAIIGAGSSGLCAAKYALENGLEPVVFDRAPVYGGLWSSNANNTAIYDGLYANCSFFCMQFSDHPHKLNDQQQPTIFPSAKYVFSYLNSYIERFNLKNCLRLSTKVEKVKYLLNKKWQVHSQNMLNNESSFEIFDFLIVATGPHSVPKIPKFKNVENFKGLILHSSQFKLDDERLRGKKCVVLGHSHSAVDVSVQCVGIASNPVTNIFRRPYLVISRFLRFKSELNANKTNYFHLMPSDFFSFRRSLTYPEVAQSKEDSYGKIEKYIKMVNVEQTNKELSHPDLFYDLSVEKEIRESVSDNYYGFVKSGHIKPKKGIIKNFESDCLVMEDGHREQADVVCLSLFMCFIFV